MTDAERGTEAQPTVREPGISPVADELGTGPELVIALVYPVGTDSENVVTSLSDALAEVEYTCDELHIIDILQKSSYGKAKTEESRKAYEAEGGRYSYYMSLMDLGNSFREDAGREDAMALFAAAQVYQIREEWLAEQDKKAASERRQGAPIQEVPVAGAEGNERQEAGEPIRVSSRHAYIIRSLKRPEEVRTLRDIYGDALIVVGAHPNEEVRREDLSWEVAESTVRAGPTDLSRPEAEELIARDQRENANTKYGQQLSEAFPLADVFVDASHPDRLKKSVGRFVELLFGYQFHTPTRAEYGMHHAFGAALRSADLSRQVGAAIVDDDGEVVALGTNEVPKPDGGLYWEPSPEREPRRQPDPEDRRDFTYGSDVSIDIKKSALDQMLALLRGEGLLAREDVTANDVWRLFEGTRLMNVGEFGRAAHAEMAAIVQAARRGIAVAGYTLFTTTFPCHVCARHIIASGIKRVVYNEPYPKSLARRLHSDSLILGEAGEGEQRVVCVPFVGVAPSLYVHLFKIPMENWRKDEAGKIPPWNKRTSIPRRYGSPLVYVPKEIRAGNYLLQTKGLGL
jgi:deoxycytidylate deaminase